MLEPSHNAELPEIPAKRYFTIGEVSELCEVKPHVLRYWEQEFTQLKPVKRRGNRRYYQRQDVILIRQIRTLLYEQGFTIGGARQRMAGSMPLAASVADDAVLAVLKGQQVGLQAGQQLSPSRAQTASVEATGINPQQIRELIEEVEEALSHLA
jgi:DNA-binding transcriptional MerR regulator